MKTLTAFFTLSLLFILSMTGVASAQFVCQRAARFDSGFAQRGRRSAGGTHHARRTTVARHVVYPPERNRHLQDFQMGTAGRPADRRRLPNSVNPLPSKQISRIDCLPIPDSYFSSAIISAAIFPESSTSGMPPPGCVAPPAKYRFAISRERFGTRIKAENAPFDDMP